MYTYRLALIFVVVFRLGYFSLSSLYFPSIEYSIFGQLKNFEEHKQKTNPATKYLRITNDGNANTQ